MEKIFNTVGLTSPDVHYFVDKKKRWNFKERGINKCGF